MNELLVILTIIITSIIGYTVIRVCNLLPKEDILLNISYSYGLGIGLISFQLYIYSRLHIPWDKQVIFAPWILLLVYFFWKNKFRINIILPKLHKLNILNSLLILGILLMIGYTAFEALLRPNGTWDAFGIWLLRANIFFIDGKINPAILNFIHVDYPLVVSLYSTFVYLLLGHIDDTAILLTSTAYFVFVALLLFSMLHKRYGLRYALFFTLLLVTTQNFIRHGGRFEAGQADLPLGYFILSCTNLFLDYIEKNNWRTFLILNIFLGITGLIKFEGMPFVLVIVLCSLIYIYKKRFFNHLVFFLFSLLPILDWQIYIKFYHFSTYFSGHKLEISLPKTIKSFTGTTKELLNIKSWNMLWIVYLYSLFVYRLKKNKELALLNIIILSQLGVYILIYIFTAENAPDSSIERLLIHLAPLAFYYIALISEIIDSQLVKKYLRFILQKKQNSLFLQSLLTLLFLL